MEKAGVSHAAALALIHATAFEGGEQWTANTMALQLSAPGAFGWIDGMGGLILARVAADEAEILTLAVAPEARRAGLGRRLLSAAMAEAAARGAASMVLEVASGNAAAIGLYGSAGFSPVGRRRAYYANGEDALILRAGLPGQPE